MHKHREERTLTTVSRTLADVFTASMKRGRLQKSAVAAQLGLNANTFATHLARNCFYRSTAEALARLFGFQEQSWQELERSFIVSGWLNEPKQVAGQLVMVASKLTPGGLASVLEELDARAMRFEKPDVPCDHALITLFGSMHRNDLYVCCTADISDELARWSTSGSLNAARIQAVERGAHFLYLTPASSQLPTGLRLQSGMTLLEVANGGYLTPVITYELFVTCFAGWPVVRSYARLPVGTAFTSMPTRAPMNDAFTRDFQRYCLDMVEASTLPDDMKGKLPHLVIGNADSAA